MKLPRLIPAMILSLPLLAAPVAAATLYPLPASPLELVTHEEKFRTFAATVAADIERQLGVPASVDDPATFKLLLSSRVHLAHHFGDNDRAIATAAWIRSLQADPADRAFAGLTTFAAVAARRGNPGAGPESAVFRAAFEKEFARLVGELPRTPAITAMLRRQRQKISDLSEAALLAETRDKIAPAIAKRGGCGLDEADQLIRVRHRIVSILPVRTETLRVLDAAIAARSAT
jgi:hypothetical protein